MDRFARPDPARASRPPQLAESSQQLERPHEGKHNYGQNYPSIDNSKQEHHSRQNIFFGKPNFESSSRYKEQFGGVGKWNSSRGGSKGRGRGARGHGKNLKGNQTLVGIPEGRNRKQHSKQQNSEKKHNFYCCSCERGFKTQELIDEHNKEHIVCGLDGCQFEAHSLVVTKHIRIQHEGNLYQRMKNLNTPEDIQRWKEERKKNFPTANKIQQKDDELKEKIERREICGIGNKRVTQSAQPTFSGFRYKIQKHDARTKSFLEYERKLRRLEYEQSAEWMRRPYAPNRDIPHVRVPFFSMNKSKVVCLENFYMNVKRNKNGKLQKQTKVKWKGFKAKQLDRLVDSDSEPEGAAIPISDDEEDNGSGNCTNTEVVQVVRKQSTTNLSSDREAEKGSNKSAANFMLVDYSSDSGEETEICSETEEPCTVSSAKATDQVLQSPEVGTSTGGKTTRGSIDATCSNAGHIEALARSATDDDMVIQEFKKRSAFKEKRILRKPSFRRRNGWMRGRLLETLLQDQIRKERNILLQTCRFVRENNFFGHN